MASSCATAQTISTSAVADTIADKMLIYQLPNGGWPKQLKDKSVVKYEAALTPDLLSRIKATDDQHATIDNKATSREINYLIATFGKTKNNKYLLAAERGIDYILQAQYRNGGWPQYYPNKSLYRAEVTYNDDAMINVLNILLNIATQKKGFDVVNQKYVGKATEAVNNGVKCILATQVKQGGKPTIWAAQYDQVSLLPAKARNFEPAALATSESANIVKFLMKLEHPAVAVRQAITHAVNWFAQTKIIGYKFAPNAEGNKALIPEDGAWLWARFYDLEQNTPVFGDRDNTVKTDVEKLSAERRNGYAWYGNWGTALIQKEYPKWQKNNP